MKPLDLVIIGGGQAGLATSYWARHSGLDHVVLDAAAHIGAAWRHRYDSLRLFTPRCFSSLPGLQLPGDPDGYPSKDEVADYLASYADTFNLPVRTGVRATSVIRDGPHLVTAGTAGAWRSRMVVTSIGPFQAPRVPPWAAEVDVPQLHSSAYRSPAQIPGPRVAVVGGGNSGAQIAEELHDCGHDVTWSISKPLQYLPERILGRSLFWWLSRTGTLDAPRDSFRSKLLEYRGNPVIAPRLRKLIDAGCVEVAASAAGPASGGIAFSDGTSVRYDSVVWCTGFTSEFGFLRVPGALDGTGSPAHQCGVATNAPGLGFVGLAWQRSRNSALIGGVGADARDVVERLSDASAPTAP